jgi:hypothetical protein
MKLTHAVSNCIARLFVAPTVMAWIALAGFTPSAFAQTTSVSEFPYNGIVRAVYGDNDLGTSGDSTYVSFIQSTNANYVAITIEWFMPTASSTTIAADPTNSATDAQLIAAIQQYHNLGIKVVLKPHVDVAGYGTWRGEITPSPVSAWFTSYQAYITHYAQLASTYNVEGLSIGTELKTMSVAANLSYWQTLISAVRADYSGPIMYGANSSGCGDEYSTVSFWSLVDIIGVDGYFGLTGQDDPTVAQIESGWTDSTSTITGVGCNAVAALQNLHSQYNKPVVFTEVGYESSMGTNEEPYAQISNGYDPTEQEDCYTAFFDVWSPNSSWMEGVFWWDLQLPVPGASDQSWVMYGKPAGTVVLPQWFGSASPGFKVNSSAPSLTIAQNGTAKDTISIQDEGGFTGSVTLAVSGLPTGVTASIGTNPTTGSSVITFTASGTATGGATTVTVTGTSGTMTATTAITVDVTTSACNIGYAITNQWQGGFGATITINNTGTTALTSWTLAWPFANGQTITSAWNGTVTQSGANVTATSLSNDGNIPAGGSNSEFGFNGTWNNITNSTPTSILLNNTSCSINGSTTSSGFTLAPSASTLSVTQGGSGTNTIAVTDLGSFTGSVTLAASGLPSGVTATFATNPTTGSSVVTFTASSTATAGTSSVIIAGTSGTLTASTAIALTVTTKVTPSFTLAASPTSLSVTQGSTATDTITVTDVGGFTGSVTLAASGLPSGVTAAFGANPATGTSVLTLTASSTATTGGPVAVTITGTSGSTTASTTISLTVNTKPTSGFSLSPSASTLSVKQGASGTDTIAVTDVGGFTGSVSFTATGLPSGVTASFSPASSTSSSVLTLTASSTATTGAFMVTITGTSGSTTASTAVTLSVGSSGGGSACTVDYTISPQNSSAFGATITIDNTSTTALTNWTLTWTFANGQTVASLWNGIETQSGAAVTVKNEPYNGSIPAGGSATGIGFNGTWNGTANAIPAAISLNGTACTVN